ncbi:branched-chain amino acid ABC transporter permease [Actinomadura madurae]|uniref:Amino acid/amide ABC transporter membrane protein 2, HAAT family n=1 Tax=Actinomadura madurae TaxID=1993 RepID=A0A1I4Y1N8_9ACTN|nr:branched-chain amino acid ABC transporter permease [Actinomadura madurae]SFN31935.1 amino acid/amide ABC transporter membrane protein 2, HAAT family [Actinomadura madurae]SPT63755.1 leucine/isoleucine/valine transporter permease subunit [Actinomadura madurae]
MTAAMSAHDRATETGGVTEGRAPSPAGRLMGTIQRHPLLLLAAMIAVLPAVIANDYYIDVASLALTFMVLGTAFNLLYGYVGMLSFAQVAFVGIGGYTSSWLVSHTGVWQPFAFLSAGVVAAAVAAVIGVVTVRLSQEAFAIITLSFSLLCALVAAEWTGVTGGRQGIFGLPAPELSLGSVHLVAETPRHYYVLLAGFTVCALWVMLRLVRSSAGTVMIAIRDNEPLTKAQGYATNTYKLAVFTLCAFVTGLTGALHVFRLTAIDPSIFDFYLMQVMLIIVILGGAGTFWPVVYSAVVFSALPEFLRMADEARLVIYGVILVAGLLFAPQGAGGLLRTRAVNRRLRAMRVEGHR